MTEPVRPMSCYQRDAIAVVGIMSWLVIYWFGGASTFQPADSAEFLTVIATRGVAHPPGYPLYTMLGILAHSLWPDSVTHALAWLAATISWGTLLGIYLTLRQLTRHRWSAFWGTCLAGMSLHLWKHATHPEAFALLGFFAAWLSAATVYALDPERTESQRRVAWFLYALGVGLASAHHHTIVFTAPLGTLLLYRLFWSNRTRLSSPWWTWNVGVLLFLLGLTPYLYLLWAGQTNTPGSWGSIPNLQALWDHFLRKEFGTLQSGIYAAERPFWFHSWQYLKRAFHPHHTYPSGLFVFPLWGLLVFLSRNWGTSTATTKRDSASDTEATTQTMLETAAKPTPHRWQREIVWAWFCSWLLAGLLFPTQLKMGTSSLDQYVAARFFLLPDIFLSLFSGIGIHQLYVYAAVLQHKHAQSSHVSSQSAPQHSWRRLKPLLHLTLCYWLVMGTVFQYKRASSQHRNWLENYALDTLREVPHGALLLEANDEAICFGILYLQRVRRLRPDIRMVCLPLLSRRWYVEQLRSLWPEFSYTWNPRHISSLALIGHYLRLKRPVHTTELYNQSIQTHFPWVPHGVTWKVWSSTQPVPSPQQVEQHLLRRYRTLSRQTPLPSPQEAPWPARLVRRYATPWLALASTYRQMRNMQAVRRCRRRARLWIP